MNIQKPVDASRCGSGRKRKLRLDAKKPETEAGKRLLDESQWPHAFLTFMAFAPKIFADKERYISFFSIFKACLNG